MSETKNDAENTAKKIKVLLCIQPDGRQSTAGLHLKDTLTFQNNKKPAHLRMTIREVEMTAEQIATLPPKDTSHTPANATDAATLRKSNLEKDLRIIELEKQLAAAAGNPGETQNETSLVTVLSPDGKKRQANHMKVGDTVLLGEMPAPDDTYTVGNYTVVSLAGAVDSVTKN